MSREKEIGRRRTFAIISHPDAGKTTITEKFLLYGGAVQLAGSVTARKHQRQSTSDWMDLERKRGISVSSTVLQFEYQGFCINLLDTPGHQDFSEDTYRVLTAVDAAVMVVDAGKGIETQTLKLFEVCSERNIPIFTFMNKCDRPMREPLELLDELEKVLKIGAFPVTWPLGDGVDFQGVYDRQKKQVHLFERTVGGLYKAPVQVGDLSDPTLTARIPTQILSKASDELAMLEGAGEQYDAEGVRSGKITPVFFGSAMNNFGVQLLLDGFLQHSPPPSGRRSKEVLISPEDTDFSGFIFKIQANMDPKHRDRIAFIRILSGTFERDMNVIHTRTQKKVRLSSSHKLFGKERETVDEAWPGDIIGIVGHSEFGIGDTLTTNPEIEYHEIPRFTPECFAFLHNANTGKFKQFRQGLDQLLQEGVIQIFDMPDSMLKVPLLGAVGPLQFEVVQYRLESEYGALARLETAAWKMVRWFQEGVTPEQISSYQLPTGVKKAVDSSRFPVLLFPNEWSEGYFLQNNKGVTLLKHSPAMKAESVEI